MGSAVMHDEHASFAALLRSLRRRRGWSQGELARRSGVAERTISDLERGLWRSPRADTSALLADALGLDEGQRQAWFAFVDAERDARGPAVGQPMGSLPTPAQPPLGRDAELAALLDRLDGPDTRILTLVGAGGVGKTRLAIEAGRRLGEAGCFVAWAPLEALGSADEVLPAIARAFGASGKPGKGPVEAIAAAVGESRTVLVVDNAEHLLDAAADLAALAAAAPGLTLLVTSREALRISGERTMAVAPLPVPAAGEDSDALARNPAVALFVAQAPDADGADLAQVGRIVKAVDGVPLAIELAAAQRETLSAAAIADLLERDSLAALGAGRRDVPARLRTMDRAVRWSYDLLDPVARRLLRTMSVFRGGADFDLLAECCERLGAPELPSEVPTLVRASLVHEEAVEGSPGRFTMLAPIRMFAESELFRDGERERAESAHLDAFLVLARDAGARILGPDAARGLAKLDRERDNVFAALDRAIRAGDGRRALGLAAQLGYWAELRGEFQPMTRWLERAIAVDDGRAAPADRWRARWFAAQFCNHQALADRAEAHGRDGVAVASDEGDIEGAGACEIVLGDVAWMRRDDHAAAERRYEAAIAALEPLGASIWLAHAHACRAVAAMSVGGHARALGDLERSLDVYGRIGNVLFVAMPGCHLGETLRVLGRPDEAREAYRRALGVSARFEQPIPTAVGLLGVAALDAASDDPAARRGAALMLGASEELFDRLGLSHDSSVDQVVSEARAALLARMPEDEIADLFAEGRAMPASAALALALGA